MKKKLKTNGFNISEYKISVVPYTVKSGETYERLSLEVVAEKNTYAYDIHQDTCYPDIQTIKQHLETSLAKAVEEYLKVEISEYTERFYLIVEFQSIGRKQYTGRRTA